MNGGYPLRPVASARTRPVQASPPSPAGANGRGLPPGPTAVARLPSADQLLATAARRSAACDS